ncbi:hypothetical protein GCM10027614_63360 [Micromonospora vulcania]
MVAGYGLWRAVRATRAGDLVTGLTLTGLVGALVSPITWTHHIYWFVPAVVLLVDAALRADRPDDFRRRQWLAGLAVGTTALIVYGMVSFQKWGWPRCAPTTRWTSSSATAMCCSVCSCWWSCRSGRASRGKSRTKWTDLPSSRLRR